MYSFFESDDIFDIWYFKYFFTISLTSVYITASTLDRSMWVLIVYGVIIEKEQDGY